MDPVVSVQNKNFLGNTKELAKVFGADRTPKVVYTGNSLEFGKACEDFSGIIVRWHHTDRKQMGLLREQCAEWKKVPLQYCCNQVWMKIHSRGVLENHFKDQSFLLVHWMSITLFCERPVKNPSIGKESLTWIVPWIRSVRGVTLEGWHTGCRHWGVGDDGRIRNLLWKTQCEGSHISQRKWKIHFPVADGRMKFSGGDQELRTPTLKREYQFEEKVTEIFLENQKGLFHHLKTHFRMPVSEAVNDFWSMSGNFMYRHHVERRIIPYSTEKHWLLQNYKNEFGKVRQERRIDDYWNIDGSRDLSDSWTGFTQFTLVEKNLQTDFCGPARDWQNGR